MRLSLQERETVECLLDVYRNGVFPMAEPETGKIAFCMANRRGVIPLEPGGLHVSRSLTRRLNSGWFDVRCDTAFEEVIRACAAPRPSDPLTWIDETIIEWFTLLHRDGRAHSVEAWRTDPQTGADHLVGGIYGLALGGAFFGESMFSRPRPRLASGERHPLDGTDASKVCMVRLVEHLRARGYTLFDTQFTNPHLERLGCREVSRDAFDSLLTDAVDRPVTWGEFRAGLGSAAGG